MEKRTITQVKLHKLVLNRMTMANIESSTIAAVSYNEQTLIDWAESQKAPEPWRDGQWGKEYKKGSPLEWFNPPSNYLPELSSWGHGLQHQWAEQKEIDAFLKANGEIYMVPE